MKEKLFIILRRYLSQNTRDKFKSSLLKFRSRFGKLYSLVYGSFTADELKTEIQNKIGDDYEILMVHTSFDNLLPMYKGNVYDLLKMLLSLTEGKTLVMPAFTFGGSSAEIIKYFGKKPFFDRIKSPTQVGLINELFRRYPGVKRSLHPTVSVCAYGKLADELTSAHHLAGTKLGEGTPFGIMDSKKTIILGIGVYYFRNLTHVHVVEDLLGNDFPYPNERKYNKMNITLVDGDVKYNYVLKEDSGEMPPFERDLSLLSKLMTKEDLMQWKYNGVPMFFAKAGKITKVLKEAAKENITIYYHQK